MAKFVLQEDLKDDAKAYFGTTWDWKKAFYINTDGTLLDGSGKNFGAQSKIRIVDHREIADIMPDKDGTEAMLAYMDEGNIRWMPETPGFELTVEPTDAQYETINKLLSCLKDTFYIDFSAPDGKVILSKTYVHGSRQVIFDIKDFFVDKRITMTEVLNSIPSSKTMNILTENTENVLSELEQVIEEAGTSDIYYHGSPKCNIVKFIVNKNDRPQSFFTKSRAYALEYAHNVETGAPGCLYTVRLNIKNPLDTKSKLGELLKHKLNCASNIEASDKIFSYLQKHNGQVKLKSKDGRTKTLTFDGIKSYEDLTKPNLSRFGETGNTCYVPLSSNQIEIIKKEKLKEQLIEDTRTQLVSKSKNADPYKHAIKGKNRFERKKYSKIANQVKSYNSLNMNDLFKTDLLTVNIPVIGETATYTVSLQLEGVVAEIANNIKNNQYKFEYRTVIQALTKIFNTKDIKVKCECKDYEMRYKHQLIINNNSIDDSAHDPGPGSTGMANTQGKGCKHILLVLANQDWIMKVSSVIHNYIVYAEEHMKQAFDKLIFPKLYGTLQSEAIDQNLVPDDVNLDTEKHIIEKINEWSKNRGKFKPGSNKNPVTGTGGKSKATGAQAATATKTEEK